MYVELLDSRYFEIVDEILNWLYCIYMTNKKGAIFEDLLKKQNIFQVLTSIQGSKHCARKTLEVIYCIVNTSMQFQESYLVIKELFSDPKKMEFIRELF